MKIEPAPHLQWLLTSNHGLSVEMNELQAQMAGLVPGSPEYLYDQLNLALEKQQQAIREAHPNLNPLNVADAKKLDDLLGADPVARDIIENIKLLSSEFPFQVAGWGIPMDPT